MTDSTEPRSAEGLSCLEEKFIPEPNSGCWLWMGHITSNGYGGITWRGKSRRAHRVIWEICNGPVPEGMDLDHLCRVRSCVNPAHLEPVTRSENARRGLQGVLRKSPELCPQGHLMEGDNVYLKPTGWRICRTCRRLWMREYRARRKATRASAGGGEARNTVLLRQCLEYLQMACTGPACAKLCDELRAALQQEQDKC